MTNKFAFEAVDRTLRDLTNKNEPFGGIVFVMSGDFRQVLPVIPWGSHVDIVSTSIKNSYLWESVEVFLLSENMRADDAIVVHLDLGNRTFANWLLCLGNNKLETIDEDYIKCPDMMKLLHANTRAIIMAIYPQLHKGQITNKYLRECAILAPHNKEVSLINVMVLSYLPSAQVNFLSADFAEDMEVANTYPSILTHWLGYAMGHTWLFDASRCESLKLKSSQAKGLVMWPLSRALSSFSITAVCHLHLQGNNFLCG